MSDLKQAAQQALEALDNEQYVSKYTHIVDAIAALRTALAEQQAEPVAWGMAQKDGLILDVICPEEHQSHEGEYTIPLYTTSPQSKPLTDEQIDDIWVEHGCEGEDAYGFARAIEAAHGIKERT